MTSTSVPPRPGHAAPTQEPRVSPPQEVESERLLQGRRELLIRHGNECYRLRHTRNDKLILTK
jgi:hemin uptake protein HemP